MEFSAVTSLKNQKIVQFISYDIANEKTLKREKKAY